MTKNIFGKNKKSKNTATLKQTINLDIIYSMQDYEDQIKMTKKINKNPGLRAKNNTIFMVPNRYLGLDIGGY